MSVMVLRNFGWWQISFGPDFLLLQSWVYSITFVELLNSRGTDRKILCLRWILRPIISIIEHLSVRTIWNDRASILNSIISSDIWIGGRSKVFVLYLTVNIDDILILIKLLDFWIDWMRCVLLWIYLNIILTLLLDPWLTSGVAIVHVVQSIFIIFILNW
jgi:hypothetical protein